MSRRDEVQIGFRPHADDLLALSQLTTATLMTRSEVLRLAVGELLAKYKGGGPVRTPARVGVGQRARAVSFGLRAETALELEQLGERTQSSVQMLVAEALGDLLAARQKGR